MGNNDLLKIDFSMVIQMINFLIMVYIFWKNFGKKIGKILDERKEIALSEMTVIETEKESIQGQKAELQKLRKESKRRANDIIIKAERQADERKEKILSDASIQRDRMIMRAEADIEKMSNTARFELQKEVTGMATQLAEKIIKENIGDKQDTIIDNFINEIGE